MKRSSKRIVIGFVVLLLGAAIIGSSWSIRRADLRQKQRITAFISEVLASARFGTSFHKRNATGEAVQSLQTYIESITAKPEISFIDYDWGIYDYRARFAGDTSFRIDVIECNGGYLVTGFRAEGR